MDPVAVSSSKLATTPSCVYFLFLPGSNVSQHMDDSQWAYSKAFFFRVNVDDDAATRDSSVCLDHCQPRDVPGHFDCHIVGRMVSTCPSQRGVMLKFTRRLKQKYPDYINTPTLLIDVVSVMGKSYGP